MAIPAAVMALLQGIADSDQVASHPFVETWYDVAVGLVNARVWRGNYSLALALVTAHYCLKYPPSQAHLDRTPVASVQTAGAPTTYMPLSLTAANADWLTTAPGRQYVELRKALIGSPTPIVI